jgi:hypothetical protein
MIMSKVFGGYALRIAVGIILLGLLLAAQVSEGKDGVGA